MTIQDHSDDGESCTFFPGGNGSLLDDSGQTTTDEGYLPKIRKPYTISKQRERWTEEEHNKFLEAVKLYGRAWRKIEEHVGTKTAVQIRSHAQKFFSKVVGESKTSQSGSSKPLEIPPPRPKKKPMHPYPRKLALPVKTDVFLQEQLVMSTSPNSSVDQEQQSPTSVLSAVASDTVGYADSGTPDGSSSPISPHEISKHGIHLPSESTPMPLELFSRVGSFVKEDSADATSTTSLKLFGKTLLLDNSAQASSSSPFLEQESATQTLNFAVVKPDESLNQFSSSILPAPVPLRAFSGGMPFPFDNIVSVKEEAQEAGSVNAPVNANLTRVSSEKYATAFVPYKRSLSSENEMQSTRLCL